MAHFHESSMFSPGIIDDEKEIKTMYIEGLMSSIWHVMLDLGKYTIIQLYSHAIKAERDDLIPKKGKREGHRERYHPYEQLIQKGGRGRDF